VQLGDIRKTGVPVALFVGLEDELATFEDARWTR